MKNPSRKGAGKVQEILPMIEQEARALTSCPVYSPIHLYEITDKAHRARARKRLQALPDILVLRGRKGRKGGPGAQIDVIVLHLAAARKLICSYGWPKAQYPSGWRWEDVN